MKIFFAPVLLKIYPAASENILRFADSEVSR